MNPRVNQMPTLRSTADSCPYSFLGISQKLEYPKRSIERHRLHGFDISKVVDFQSRLWMEFDIDVDSLIQIEL